MSLVGKTVLVTRAKEQAHELSKQIKAHGGTAIEIPLLAFEAVQDTKQLDEAILRLDHYEWLMFTSVNGVHFFMRRFLHFFPHRNEFPGSIAVVGEKTEAALLEYGIKTDVLPADYTAEGMAEVLKDCIKPGDRVLLTRGNRGRYVLNETLEKIGAKLDDITIYNTIFPKKAKEYLQRLVANQTVVDYATFTSSSTVTHYHKLIGQLEGKKDQFLPKVACIGPIAAHTARELGMSVDLMPQTYTVDALVKELVKDAEKENEQ